MTDKRTIADLSEAERRELRGYFTSAARNLEKVVTLDRREGEQDEGVVKILAHLKPPKLPSSLPLSSGERE
jgi:hypothetical protein